MGNIKKFYENTENALPHKNIQYFVNIHPAVGNAIELGCGVGRDTIFLLKNKWNVLAIDREDTEANIVEKLNKEELSRFKFEKQEFESIKLIKNDLVLANFSIPFCNKDYFDVFWKEITNSISKGRVFCRKFFWNK